MAGVGRAAVLECENRAGHSPHPGSCLARCPSSRRWAWRPRSSPSAQQGHRERCTERYSHSRPGTWAIGIALDRGLTLETKRRSKHSPGRHRRRERGRLPVFLPPPLHMCSVTTQIAQAPLGGAWSGGSRPSRGNCLLLSSPCFLLQGRNSVGKMCFLELRWWFCPSLAILGIEPRSSSVLGQCLTSDPHLTENLHH